MTIFKGLTTSLISQAIATASLVWDLGRSSTWRRLYVVSYPYVMLTWLSPKTTCRSWTTRLFREDTCAASFNGTRAFACTSGKPNSAAVCCPLRRLQAWQARVRLLARLLPPLDLGIICSSSKGTSRASQYAHVLCHFVKTYSRRKYPCSSPCWYSK